MFLALISFAQLLTFVPTAVSGFHQQRVGVLTGIDLPLSNSQPFVRVLTHLAGLPGLAPFLLSDPSLLCSLISGAEPNIHILDK